MASRANATVTTDHDETPSRRQSSLREGRIASRRMMEPTIYFRSDDPDPPLPPSQTPPAPVTEPPDTPVTEPASPVREPGPTPPKRY